MKRMNLYFFGEEEISFQDGFYFYGMNLLGIVLLFLMQF